MDNDTRTLTDFLLARIAEDEEAAREPRGLRRWKIGPGPGVRTADGDRLVNVALETLPRQRTALAAHIARHDPTRVLAECEAKRRIVELGRFSDSPESAVDFWLEDGKGRTPPQPLGTIVEVFRILALPYADHPDYRPEWRA